MNFREQLFSAYGEEGEAVLRGCVRRPATLRVNPLKMTEEDETLFAAKKIGERVPWYRDAFVLSVREDTVRALPFYSEGKIYLQSLSSMLPPLLLNAKAGEDVLDMTAAPGSKTTQICALTGNGALVTACERDNARFERLSFNIRRQGARVNLLHCDALSLDEAFSFDKILLDAPCSGSATLTEERDIGSSFVEKCALRQEKLLKKALKLLKRGGTLLYSTCSVLPRENWEALERATRGQPVSAVPLSLPEQCEAKLLPSPEGTLCICPDERFEGFFLSAVKKL